MGAKSKKLKRKEYEAELRVLHGELVAMQEPGCRAQGTGHDSGHRSSRR